MRHFNAKVLCWLFTGLLLSSCEHTLVPAQLFDQETEGFLVSFKLDENNHADWQGAAHLVHDSGPYRQLVRWFEENNNYWYRDDVNSAHQTIALLGSDLKIDIYETFIRIGYTNDDGYFRQYWRSCKLEEFAFLMELKK